MRKFENLLITNLPNNPLFTLTFQKFIYLFEMTVTEKATVGRKGGGMGRHQNMMFILVDKGCFGLGKFSPEKKYDSGFFFRNRLNNSVSSFVSG